MNPEVSYYTVSSFVSLNPIKSGSGGMISIGELQDSRKMAVKQFKSSREQPLEIFKKEIEILLKYKHPNLVELHGILWDGLNKSVFLGYVMEYIDGGSLNEIIHNHGRLYTQSEICQWIVQIGAGLQYLHDNGILHRDVKPANILVAGDTMKLADLGVAKYSDATTTAGAGTFRYMAPEVLSSGKCSPSSDAFSLAITAWEIFHRKVPYYELGDMTGLALLNKIVAGVRPTIETDKMDKEVAALLRRSWKTKAANRMSVKEILDTFGEKVGRLSGQMGLKTILIMGGVINNNKEYAGMAVLSGDRSEWIELKLKLPYEANGSGAVYLNGEIYLISGYYNPKALYKLDKNMEWIRLADMNERRMYITNSCLEWNGYIWVFGGRDRDKTSLQSVERYDPIKDKWILMPEMKTGRSSAATALWNDKIIISGGSIAEKTVTNTSECFNLEVGWVGFPNMPTHIDGHSLVSYRNKLILIGGAGSELFNSVWKLDPLLQSNSEWKPLPPIKYSFY